MQQQSELQIAAEQADKNEERLKVYRAKRNKLAPFEDSCAECGRMNIGHGICYQCSSNKQRELQESLEHPYA